MHSKSRCGDKCSCSPQTCLNLHSWELSFTKTQAELPPKEILLQLEVEPKSKAAKNLQSKHYDFEMLWTKYSVDFKKPSK